MTTPEQLEQTIKEKHQLTQVQFCRLVGMTKDGWQKWKKQGFPKSVRTFLLLLKLAETEEEIKNI